MTDNESPASLIDLPLPPYTAVIFTSMRPTGPLSSDDGYGQAAESMDAVARLQPGFLGVESARDASGFGITVSYWRTDNDARAWKAVAEHVDVQRQGRSTWYLDYRVQVSTVERSYGNQGGPNNCDY
jgi:heme-degrading monooxygenase HmoA